MRNQAEKDIRLAEMNDKQKECLIEQQREVTGNYSDEVKLGEGNVSRGRMVEIKRFPFADS
jgi:hypothetical protein